jgi:hypothetical protein
MKPHPQGSGFRQKALYNRQALPGRAKHMHPRAGPILFHLHRHPENIQGAVREQRFHQIAEDLRIHIVDTGFHHHQRFGALGGTGGIHRRPGKRVPTTMRNRLGRPSTSRDPAP